MSSACCPQDQIPPNWIYCPTHLNDRASMQCANHKTTFGRQPSFPTESPTLAWWLKAVTKWYDSAAPATVNSCVQWPCHVWQIVLLQTSALSGSYSVSSPSSQMIPEPWVRGIGVSFRAECTCGQLWLSVLIAISCK